MFLIILLSSLSVVFCLVNVKMYKIIAELEDKLSMTSKSRWTNSSNISFQHDSITENLPPGTWGECSSFHVPPSFQNRKKPGENSVSWSAFKSQTASLSKSVSNKIKNVVHKLEETSVNLPILTSTPVYKPMPNPSASLYVPPNLAGDFGLAGSTNTNPFLSESAAESTYITAPNSFNTYNTFDASTNPLNFANPANSEIDFPQNIESPPFANKEPFAQDYPNTAYVNKLTQNAQYDPLMNDSF